jgi:predicted GIY-YIG superfamily endonuclease
MAEITTRTVRVFDVPRSLLNEFLAMNESSQVGVYYLMGIAGTGKSECYIGQTGNVGKRLKQHAASKEFWSRALVAVSLTNSWTSTHVGYMEWMSIKAAKEAGKYDLHNLDNASNPHTLAPLEAEAERVRGSDRGATSGSCPP